MADQDDKRPCNELPNLAALSLKDIMSDADRGAAILLCDLEKRPMSSFNLIRNYCASNKCSVQLFEQMAQLLNIGPPTTFTEDEDHSITWYKHISYYAKKLMDPQTAISDAARYGRVRTLRWILSFMTTETKKFPAGIPRPTERSFWTDAIQHALDFRRLETLKVLITEGYSDETILKHVFRKAVLTAIGGKPPPPQLTNGDDGVESLIPIIDWVLSVYKPTKVLYENSLDNAIDDGTGELVECLLTNARRHYPDDVDTPFGYFNYGRIFRQTAEEKNMSVLRWVLSEGKISRNDFFQRLGTIISQVNNLNYRGDAFEYSTFVLSHPYMSTATQEEKEDVINIEFGRQLTMTGNVALLEWLWEHNYYTDAQMGKMLNRHLYVNSPQAFLPLIQRVSRRLSEANSEEDPE